MAPPAWNAGFSRHTGRRPARRVGLLARMAPPAWNADVRPARAAPPHRENWRAAHVATSIHPDAAYGRSSSGIPGIPIPTPAQFPSMNTDRKTRTCLWFESGGEDAARFYVTLLPDSRIESIYRTQPDQPALVVDFTLGGAPYQILNGGPEVTQSAAVSISVVTEDQAETDRLWDALTADGGKEGRCAWLTDRWGVSWQIVPRVLIERFMSDDRAGAERAFQAMLTMNKVDVAVIEAAFRGA